MKNRILALLAFCGLVFLFSNETVQAQDGFFSDAQTLEPGIISAGLQPVILTDQEDFMLIARGAYGISSGLTVHGKIGVLEDETYFGAHAEYRILSEAQDPLTVSGIGGIYTYGDPGLKLAAVASKQLDLFSIFGGLNYQPLFIEDNTLHPFLIPFGLDIPLLDKQANFVFEANVGVNDDAGVFESLTFGVNYYLN